MTEIRPAGELPGCSGTGERNAMWLMPEPGMNDAQKGGLFVMSLFRGLSSAMKAEPQAGSSCDIHPTSILAMAGQARGVAVGPVVYAPNTCRPHREADFCSPAPADRIHPI